MGIVNRPQLQAWLREWHQEGTLPFDTATLDQRSYIGLTAELELQPQLQAAFELHKKGEWTREDYDHVRGVLEYEHNPDRDEHVGSAEVFNPFAVKASPLFYDKGAFEAYQNGELTLDEYIELLGVIAPTGKVETAEGVKPDKRSKKSADPLRNKSGSFAYGVGQLWFYDSRTGKLDQRPFTGKRALAKAFGHCAEIQSTWNALDCKLPCAWVKVRIGSRRKTADGREGVVLVDAHGMIASPQNLIRLHAQAKAQGIKSPVGEVVSGTKLEHIIQMLENNKIEGVARVNGRGPNIRRTVARATVEPSPQDEIVYSIRYYSKRVLTVRDAPLSDEKDDDGNITLEGHRKRAFRLLLESPCAGADSPSTIQYVVYGKFMVEKPRTFVIGWDQAMRWDAESKEDEVLTMLWKGYALAIKRGVTDEERQQYMTARWTRLQEIDPIAKGKHEAKARFQEELWHANQKLVPVLNPDGSPKIGKKTGKPVMKPMISDSEYARMVNWNHPSYRERTGPVCPQTMTRIDYDPDTGRHVWGNNSNDGGPGTNWVGGNTRRPKWHLGMSYLEAQLYNM
tara:strand:- start:33 stop:1733 length:1701 start_codon:yes stop_codon:yes gene_type:complete